MKPEAHELGVARCSRRCMRFVLRVWPHCCSWRLSDLLCLRPDTGISNQYDSLDHRVSLDITFPSVECMRAF